MVTNMLQSRVDRVTYPKRADISAAPATRTLLRDTMRGVIMQKLDVSTPKYPDTFSSVDDGDFKRAGKYKWHAYPGRTGRTLYAARRKGHRGKMEKLHHFIMGVLPKNGYEIDHKNGDGLDNRKSNLRYCTHAQNSCNRRKQVNNTSGYTGVSWDKSTDNWKAQIKVAGKCLHIGRFSCLVKAAKAYDKEAIKHFGEFASPNFPMPIPQLPEKGGE